MWSLRKYGGRNHNYLTIIDQAITNNKMKRTLVYAFLLTAVFIWAGCKKGTNYPGGRISEYIPLYDLRNLYKGSDLTLTVDNMYGSDKITGIVISDYSGSNMPGGYLVIQDHRRLSLLRGIAIPIGVEAAAKYASGDSVSVTIAGGTLTRADGILQIKNIPATAVTKISSGNNIPANRVPSSSILKDPARYESTLVAIVKGGFDPLPTPTDKFGGDKTVNDGFENITLHTDAGATFANNGLPVLANFYGIVFNTAGAGGKLIPQIRMRKADDMQLLSSTIKITPIVISGFVPDVIGGDGNYEYIQMLATQDIDFSQTPYSVVVCNNAGAANPAGYPSNGWAMGGNTTGAQFRTYKFNLTAGTAKKGSYFYVGGTAEMINGSSSTSMASSNWIRVINYTTTNGDGFGSPYSGLMANSGNAWGMAVFAGTTVTKNTEPVDVLFINSGGQLLSGTNGYKITNTDWYDVVNPITLQSQPYYKQGSNTLSLTYPPAADLGYYYKLGGAYNPRLGKWVKARSQNFVQLTKTSSLNEIEGEFPVGTADKPGLLPTTIQE
jgi:hypothetical protein